MLILLIKNIYVRLVKPKFVRNCNFISRAQMMKFMMKGGSIVRFGDGEFSIMAGISSPEFQKNSDTLRVCLDQVFDFWDDSFLICIPMSIANPNSYKKLTPRAAFFWLRFMNRNYKWLVARISTERCYGDAQFSRPYMDTLNYNYCEKYFKEIKLMFAQKEITVIEGSKTRFGVGNDLLEYARSVKRIVGPSVDAFNALDDLEHVAKKLPKSTLIILALGPASKPLALRLFRLGYQVWDLGHLDVEYEWFRKRVSKKELIPGKYVNENPLRLAQELPEKFLEKYNKEIIYRTPV